ncbi:MAG: precorrin-6y C5,15-methyltransferase (decarboxylating) subunit CbiE [Pelosinus sp.]|nr:precorrin-6y C5,15-methyltransferase (decarboxylating) subunit CbiE [Pelosinus sp.]
MEYKIIVVGIGPGGKDYLLPIASNAIDEAKVLVGSRRALETLAPGGIETKVIDREITALLDYIEEKIKVTSVTVLVSGDPGFYSLLVALKGRFPVERLVVIPGISSAQLAFARISEPWQDALLISMHGRSASDEALGFIAGKKLGILTDANHNPAFIARLLINEGWPLGTKVWLCSGLSYETEEVRSLTLDETQEISGFEHSVMVVKA